MGVDETLSTKKQEQAAQMATLSHEFKTPLSVTLTTLDLIQKKLRQNTDFYTEEYETLFGIASRNIYKVLRMANNFIDAGRFESGVTTLHFYEEDVVRILCQAEENIAPMLQSRGARIDFVCKTKTPCLIECDTQALDRILLNLVSNAIKHLPQQNGRILLVLETQDDPKMLCISVIDNGSGICKESLPHLFERYWHDESENSVDKTSTGLGLYLVKELVDLHGGTISVQSEPHIATTFSIVLPLRRPQGESDDVLRSTAMLYDVDTYKLLFHQELSDVL